MNCLFWPAALVCLASLATPNFPLAHSSRASIPTEAPMIPREEVRRASSPGSPQLLPQTLAACFQGVLELHPHHCPSHGLTSVSCRPSSIFLFAYHSFWWKKAHLSLARVAFCAGCARVLWRRLFRVPNTLRRPSDVYSTWHQCASCKSLGKSRPLLAEAIRREKGRMGVVTGASDRIGKEFALQVAGRGFNVLLVAWNTALLGSVAEEIQAKYLGTQTAIDMIRGRRRPRVPISVDCGGRAECRRTRYAVSALADPIPKAYVRCPREDRSRVRCGVRRAPWYEHTVLVPFADGVRPQRGGSPECARDVSYTHALHKDIRRRALKKLRRRS
ncbi:hypothetical protein C8R45DRAFT_393087 [Mycena sanguinolenta]|nr:hypothetical protein C8R45DRAFT_393087 [Mycena sanguinolenta]